MQAQHRTRKKDRHLMFLNSASPLHLSFSRPLPLKACLPAIVPVSAGFSRCADPSGISNGPKQTQACSRTLQFFPRRSHAKADGQGAASQYGGTPTGRQDDDPKTKNRILGRCDSVSKMPGQSILERKLSSYHLRER
jgi:hypothetical protein